MCKRSDSVGLPKSLLEPFRITNIKYVILDRNKGQLEEDTIRNAQGDTSSSPYDSDTYMLMNMW